MVHDAAAPSASRFDHAGTFPRLRYASDRRTLLFTLGLIPALPLLQYAYPALLGWVLPLQLYFGFASGAIAHNHNHSPTFHGRRANAAFSTWLSVLYGAPIFGWIPTHNQNHHRFANGPGDDTITWRYTRSNSLRSLLSYFFVSNWFQAPVISEYLRKTRAQNPRLHRQTVVQRVAVVASHAVMLGGAIGLHGVGTGVGIYLLAFVVQIGFGLWSMFYINFLQHVDCDPRSQYDHSRNFVGRLSNILMFNAGYHTAHHERPGAHWSTLPALHAAIEDRIDRRLKQRSLLWFTFKTYALGPFFPAARTQQVGRPAWDGATSEVAPLPVLAVDAGENAARAYGA